MLGPNAASQNKLRQSGVFLRVAATAQHLDVFRVGAFRQVCSVRVDVMSLELILASAFFALLAVLYDLEDRFPASVAAFAGASFPVMVVFARHVFPTGSRHARDRAVLASSTSSFSPLEAFRACLTHMQSQRQGFSRSNFLRACYRTCVSRATDMRVRALEQYAAHWACEHRVSTSRVSSGSLCHG